MASVASAILCADPRASYLAHRRELDVAIQEGVVFDVVYVTGRTLGEYSYCALRFAALEFSPLVTLDAPSAEQLRIISPASAEIAADARTKLAS